MNNQADQIFSASVNHSGNASNRLPFPTREEEIASLQPIQKGISESYKAVMAICAYADVPDQARMLIHALIRLSEGNSFVKVTDHKIANIFYKDKDKKDAVKKKIQRWRKSLKDWQEQTEIQLVKIRSGRQVMKIGTNGVQKPQNEASEYYLTVLEMAATVLAQNSGNFESSVATVVGNLAAAGSDLDRPKKRHLSSDRCLNSGLTWIRKSLDKAKEDGYLDEFAKEVDDRWKELWKESVIAEIKGGTETSHPNSGSGGTYLGTINTNSNSILNKSTSHERSNIHSLINKDNGSAIRNDCSDACSNSTFKRLVDHAISHAKRGFRVFPVYKARNGICSCRNGKLCDSPAKHPRIIGWNHLATCDEKQIREWWKKYSEANVGILTGVYDSHNWIVLDVDPKSSGFESLTELESKYGKLPDTLTAVTGSGGRHYIFSAAREVVISNIQASSKLGKGLDIRGKNGFIVAAGSTHGSGKKYQWLDETSQISEMPLWMLDKIVKPVSFGAEVKGTVTSHRNSVVTSNSEKSNVAIHEHEGRNNFLFGKAIGLFHNGHSKDSVIRRLADWNNKVCIPPVSHDELNKIISSAEKTAKRPALV
jgi:Bifunctional DNA primase/polymerase, N-terminal/Primase C terminal 1 (PriCT-1)